MKVRMPEAFYRRDTFTRYKDIHYPLINGGIGDYICHVPALHYLAEQQPQVKGHIYCSPFMTELIAHFMAPYPHWKVHDRKDFQEEKIAGDPIFTSGVQPINATGCHPLDLGFIHFVGTNPPPEGYNFYPRLDFKCLEGETPKAPYAVMTPGATTENRTLPARTFNGIKDHLIKLGITPMFLGQKQITEVRRISYDEGYDYTGGVDLRDQTTLLEAAAHISKAKLIVGLDNGLLHLAACTDTPIVFGYNIASPLHRRPRRKSGNIWEIFPDQKELPCTFCQSNMRYLVDHDFALCLYRDNKCLDAISDPESWCKLIDDLLKKTG